MMSAEDFRRVLDNVGKQANSVQMYFMGESCLNSAVYEMLPEARKRQVYTSVCTNGEVANSGDLLVARGASEVHFQIGGISQETHATYRVNGDLGIVVDNIKLAVKERDWGFGFRDAKLTAGLIVMRHNEHEVAAFPEWCQKLRVEPELIRPCVRTQEQAEKFLPDNQDYWLYNPESIINGGPPRMWTPNHNRCWWIYYSTVVCWNGDVVPCCRDASGDYVMGNVLKEDFGDIWNGARYQEFRRIIATDQNRMPLCRLCSGFGIPRLK